MRPLLILSVTGLGLILAHAPARGRSEEVTIPLRGVLPLRCEAKILSTRVDNGVKLTVDALVQHRCNAAHILTVSHKELPGQRAGDVTITYNGVQPTSASLTSASFDYGPVTDGTRPLRVVFVLGERGANPGDLARTIRVEVAPR